MKPGPRRAAPHAADLVAGVDLAVVAAVAVVGLAAAAATGIAVAVVAATATSQAGIQKDRGGDR
jgi:hypothetical protein